MNHFYSVLLLMASLWLTSDSTTTKKDWVRATYYNNVTKNIDDNKIKIKVFYETLCPGSINFFETELLSVVETLSVYLDLILVPYGFAKTSYFAGKYSFLCQYGPQECFGNKIHACVIDELSNNTKAVMVNSCLMKYTRIIGVRGMNYRMFLNWCTYQMNVNTAAIWRCVYSLKGTHLLRINGKETHARRPPYVPYVEIYSAAGRPYEVTGHLMVAVCNMLEPAPPPCPNYSK